MAFNQITPYVGTLDSGETIAKPAFQSVPIRRSSSDWGFSGPGYDEWRRSFLL